MPEMKSIDPFNHEVPPQENTEGSEEKPKEADEADGSSEENNTEEGK